MLFIFDAYGQILSTTCNIMFEIFIYSYCDCQFSYYICVTVITDVLTWHHVRFRMNQGHNLILSTLKSYFSVRQSFFQFNQELNRNSNVFITMTEIYFNVQHAFISVLKPILCHSTKVAIDHRVIEVNRISGYLKILNYTHLETQKSREL